MDSSTRTWRLRQNVARDASTRTRDEERTVSGWGAIPIASLFAAVGLVFVALGNTVARFDWPFPDVPFWVGIGLVVVPVALRLVASAVERAERIGLVVLLAIATYVVKILHSPSYFTLFDELLHVRTAEDIARTGHLFSPNPLLIVSPLFPGLELVTDAVSRLTGVSTFEAGLVVVGIARVLLVLALFALFEEVSGSARAAGVAAFLYATNPSFLFFDAQFAYESLALPMAVVAIFAGAKWQRDTRSRPLAILTIAAIATVVVTHHLTSYVLLAYLALWTAVSLILGGPRRARIPVISLGFAAVAIVVWTVVFASAAISYMAPHIANALDLIRLLLGQTEARTLFQTGTGVPAADWERATAILTTVITLVIVAAGLWIVWRTRRRDIMAVVLAIGALGYPASLALRLTEGGAEESTRIPEFVFLGVAFLGGLVVEWLAGLRLGSRERVRSGVLAAAAALVFIGGVIIGVPRWARLPGPFLPSADPRSISPEGRAAASWSAAELGTGNRLATDRINRVLLGADALQYPVTSYGDGVDSWRLFYTPTVDTSDRRIIQNGRIRYLVTDQRLTTSLPLTRVYFENGEPGMFDRTQPLDARNLNKWDAVADVSRVYDSGNIRVFDVGRVLRGS